MNKDKFFGFILSEGESNESEEVWKNSIDYCDDFYRY